MSIGTTIKRLRRERDMTQEQLAEYLGISANAVSQWECDRTAPDISQLPVLVRIFNTSADELLEIDLKNKEAEIKDLSDRINQLSQLGRKKEAYELAKTAIKTYPDSYVLMADYIGLHCYIQYDNSYTEDERQEYRKKCISLCEKIVDGCTEDRFRLGAINDLCRFYSDDGDIEKAEEMAMRLPHMVYSRNLVFCEIYRGNKRIEANQSLMHYNLLQYLMSRMSNNYHTDTGELFYSREERCQLAFKKIAVLEAIFENGDFGFYFDDLAQAHSEIADFYADSQDVENTLSHLEASSDAIVSFLRDYYGKDLYEHTSLLFRNFVTSGKGLWFSENDNDAVLLLNSMKRSKFDFVRGDDRFQKVVEKLTAVAGTWNE